MKKERCFSILDTQNTSNFMRWMYNKKEIPVWFINKEKRTLFTGIDRIEMEGRFK